MISQHARLILECHRAVAVLRKAGLKPTISRTFDRNTILGVEVRSTGFSFIGRLGQRVIAENLFFTQLGVGGVEREAIRIAALQA